MTNSYQQSAVSSHGLADNKMLIAVRFLLFIFHISLLFGFFSQLYGETITEVEVKGNRNTDTDLILSTSGTRVGEELTAEVTQKAIRRLYDLGLFSEVNVEMEGGERGLKVILAVKEHPLLSQMKLEDNKKISSKKIEKEIKATPGEILSPQKIFKWKNKIEEMYEKKGYLQAKVEEEVSEPNEEGRSLLILRIIEGKDVRIKEVVILGNKAFPDSKIESKMKNKHKRFLRSGKFEEKLLEGDLEKIVQFYRKNGYMDAKIKDHRFEQDETKRWLVIVIEVDEGPQFHLGEVTFGGNALFPEENLKEKIRLKGGEIYNAEKMEESLVDLYGLYSEEGYIYASISPSESAHNDVIDVQYQILEGKPAHVRKIEVEGNRTTREKVIRRELEIMPGDIFKRSKVISSQRDVFNLGFFEDVQLDSKPANEEGDIDLILKVKEKSTGQIGAGMSFSALDGLTGYISLTVPNLFGKGQKGNILLERGGRKTNIQLGFTEPWFLDTPTSVGFDLFHLNRNRIDGFKERRTGGDLRLSRELIKDLRGYWMYRLEDVELSLDEDNFVLQQSDGISSSTRFTFVRDTRDNFFNSKTGMRNSFSVENSGRFMGGDIHYQTYNLESRWFHPSFWKFIFSLGGRIGYVTDYLDPDVIPLFERFILGGVGEWGLRGYSDRSIYVRDERLGGKDVPMKRRSDGGIDPGRTYKIGGQTVRIGGRTALVLSAEHKFPIAQNFYGLFFAEAGNTWEDFESIRLENLDDLKKSSGLGIRMEIPLMGVLGFDLGYGFDSYSRRNGPGWEFHFQAGSAF